MFKRNRKYNQVFKKLKQKDSIKLDEEGRTIINITVNDDSNFLLPYTSMDTPIISEEVAEFLSHSVKHLKPKSKIHFVVSSNCIDLQEKEVYPKAINNYFSAEFIELSNDINRIKWISIIMTLIGAFFFSLALILEHSEQRAILSNIIDVVAWVFVWEAVDLFVIQRAMLQMKRHRCYEIMHCKMTFKEIEK